MVNDRELAQALLCKHFGHYGGFEFPYVKMGRIDSLDLFGVTELIIFAFYHQNRKRYRHVLDIGANLGLHSILMSRLGWTVKAYEPDFEHYQRLISNLATNLCGNVKPHMAAVSTREGEASFVRVMNNLTGNHLEGYKDSYGPTQKVIVPTVDCRALFAWADLAKIDSEGNEAELLTTLDAKRMRSLDVIVEVRNKESAKRIYEHFYRQETPMYSQKNSWARVTEFSHMPLVNREGSLFIGREPPFV